MCENDNTVQMCDRRPDVMDYIEQMSSEEKYAYYLTMSENDSLGIHGAVYLNRADNDSERVFR